MKKTLLVLAGLLTATSAQAADLAAPAAEPVDYVRVCDAYGTGFFYIPGTETCLKIGGYVRVDAYVSLMERGGGLTNPLGWDDRNEGIAARARGNITFEAINNTDFGPLQSFISINSTLDTRTGNATTLDYAWIKWAGFTFGFTDSFFTFYGGGADVLLTSAAGPDDLNIVWAYTAAFGNGISASLSIEAPVVTRSNGLFAANTYGGTRWPDVVANVKVEQAWGAAQVMGALHHNYGLAAPFVDKVGFAVGAGLKVNIPGLGSASDFSMQAAYGRGATLFVDPASPFADFSPTGTQTTSWGVAAGLNLGFTEQVSLGVHASYAMHDNGPATVNSWTAMGDVTFKPVSGLQFRTGLEYRSDDFNAAAGNTDASELVGFFRVQRSF